ncbi:SapC family protein [Kordiimonas sp.]|uniref:SapC family protein n=1 Tax=Kordiimonas sp. TaxID=1970157 RepID=UPI003B52E125
MATVVTLDNVEHHDLKVSADRGAVFGDNINQALVFPNEFRDAQREYPILFRKDKDGAFQSVVLLGFDRDENLFLKGKVWDARYMPAVQARGPFMIGVHRSTEGEEADVKVHVDLDNPAVNKESGYALFLPHGGQSPYLNHIINVLRTLHDGLSISKTFFGLMEEFDLIEPLTLEVKIDDTRQYTVPQVYSISEEKFRGLSHEALGRLHETGMLAYCYWVLGSLDNIRPLVDRKIRA